MKLPEKEREFNRNAFREMSILEKADYIFAYYKLPLVIIGVVITALVTVVYHAITDKEAVVYTAYCNIVPNETADATLTDGFIEHIGADSKEYEVVAYHELYISTDDSLQNHQYAYASKLKLLGSIDGEKLDVVIMNGEAYDLISGWGYLLDLSEACAASSADRSDVSGAIVSNVVVLSDNRVEVELGEADEYVAETIEVPNAIDVTGSSIFGAFAEDDTVYLGIIANSPRTEASLDYLEYVLEAE